MKPPFAFVCFGLVLGCLCGGTASLRADDLTRRAQQTLHDQGFYYGPLDGVSGDETLQAIRRYQIRNGLAVTGQLNAETRRALQLGDAGDTDRSAAAPPPSAAPAPAPPSAAQAPTPAPAPRRAAPAPAPPPPAAPPREDRGRDDNGDIRLGPGSPYRYSRPDLRAQPGRGPGSPEPGEEEEPAGRGPAAPSGPPPGAGRGGGGRPALPPGAEPPSPLLGRILEGTDYEFAPPAIQFDVVRRAQFGLRRAGFYDGALDGIPGPQFRAALAEYQGAMGIARSGRLDDRTLTTLRLQPDRGDSGFVYRHRVRPPPPVIYEGRIAE